MKKLFIVLLMMFACVSCEEAEMDSDISMKTTLPVNSHHEYELILKDKPTEPYRGSKKTVILYTTCRGGAEFRYILEKNKSVVYLPYFLVSDLERNKKILSDAGWAIMLVDEYITHLPIWKSWIKIDRSYIESFKEIRHCV